MRTSLLRLTTVCAVTIGQAAIASAQRGPQQPPMVKEGVTEKISDHVYVIPDGNVGLVPNVAIVVGTRGTFVVDTGLGARNGQAILREVAKVSRNTELYLATTHVHPEHDLGAHAFPANTRMIRSRDQEGEIADTGLETAKRFASFSPVTAELLQGAEFRKADVLFDKEHTVDLGGVRVRLMAMGGNHTRGDTAFFVEPDDILVSGDVVMTALPGFGSPSSRLSTWLASLDRFEKLKPKRIVPSHGPMGDASMIATYRDYFRALQTRVAELKKQGRSSDEAAAVLQEEMPKKYPGLAYRGANRVTLAAQTAYTEAR